MTISIRVSVNGSYKVPVTVQREGVEDSTQTISGRGHDGPKVLDIPYYHGASNVVTVVVGPEEYDHGEETVNG